MIRFWSAAKKCFIDAVRASLELFKVMIPIIIAVKVLQELGLIRYLAVPLAPVMKLVGLPPETGLVWAAAVANNLYAGFIVYAALIPDMPVLSAAQVTVLCTMMLIAHALPVELRIAQKCGIGLWGQFLLRMFGALACGALLSLVFSHWDLLQEPGRMLWRPEAADTSWLSWTWDQVRGLGMIVVVISALMAVMRTLDAIGVTRLFIWILGPVLRFLGIGRQAATITIIGLTMGITYGGGLIIHEVNTGTIDRRDVFSSVSLMGLSHGLIEDSMLMVLMGASTVGIVWGRLAFSLVVIAVLTRLVWRFTENRRVKPDGAFLP